MSKGEAQEKGEDLKDDNDDVFDSDSSDEEVGMPVKNKPVVTPRKSCRLASKGKRLVASLDDDSSSHNTLEPTTTCTSFTKASHTTITSDSITTTITYTL